MVVPSNRFLPVETIKLGRVIIDLNYPHEGYNDPLAETPSTINANIEYPEGTKITNVGLLDHQRASTSYRLDTHKNYFDDIALTKAWIERHANEQRNIYLVVSFTTVKDPRIALASGGRMEVQGEQVCSYEYQEFPRELLSGKYGLSQTRTWSCVDV
jgi:hypothetical protein